MGWHPSSMCDQNSISTIFFSTSPVSNDMMFKKQTQGEELCHWFMSTELCHWFMSTVVLQLMGSPSSDDRSLLFS